MESNHQGFSVPEFYRNKVCLVTGTTGFVGKVILEKMLYSLPDIEIIVLIRGKKGSSVEERLKKEIVDSECFSRIKERERGNYVQWFLERVQVIQGDLSQENLGIKEDDLKMLKERVQVLINCAASVDFNASIINAIQDNIEGTLKVYHLATQCPSLISMVHISTAYVNCNRREQWIDEQIYPSGDIQLDNNPLDYIRSLQATPQQDVQTVQQQELNRMGFPNTYTFTKHFAEKILQIMNKTHKLPLTICRPSIVGCSMKQPYPGWIDSISAAAAFYTFVGLGVIRVGHGSLDLISDQVPVDMVADSVLVCAAFYAHSNQFNIYHCVSSSHNPVTWNQSKQPLLQYFRQNPFDKQITKPDIQLYENKHVLQLQQIRHRLPALAYDKYAQLFGDAPMQRKAAKYISATNKAEEISRLFKHFTSNQWIFQSHQQQLISNKMSLEDNNTFFIDSKKIDWNQYMNNFAWGLKYFIMKEPIDPPFVKNQIVKTKDIQSKFGDLKWISDKKINYIPSSRAKIIKRVLGNQEVIGLYEKEGFKGYEKAYRLCQSAFADYEIYRIKTLAYLIHKLFKRVFDRVFLDESKMEQIKKLERSGPVILIGHNQSHFDFLIMNYIFFTYDIKPPYVQSSQQLLNIKVITSWLKACGGYFINQKTKNSLEMKIADEYLKELLIDGANLSFFINDSRLRSGKLTKPNNPLLQRFIQNIYQNNIPVKNLHIVPVAISYDVVYEAEVIPLELVGEKRIKESFGKFLNSGGLIFKNLGRVFVELGEPQNISECALQLKDKQQAKEESRKLLNETMSKIQSMIIIMPIQIVSSVLLMQRRGISEDQLIQRCDWVSVNLQKRGLRIGAVSEFSSQISIKESLKHLSKQVTQKRDMFGPSVQPKQEHFTLQLLSYCRNSLLNPLQYEMIMAVAIFSFGHQMACEEGVDVQRVMDEYLFLSNILSYEFIDAMKGIHPKTVFDNTLQQMAKLQVVLVEEGKVKVLDDKMVTYLCSLCWPLVESYWVTLVYFLQLKNNPTLFTSSKLTQQIQWYAESLGEERILEHLECVSFDSIGNSLKKYLKMEILRIDPNSLLELIAEDQHIKGLEQHVQKLMKHTFSKTLAIPVNLERKNNLLDFPYISKL